MSSLTSPTPRIPIRSLAMNGIEATSRASAPAITAPGTTRPGTASMEERRTTRTTAAAASITPTVIATAVPWPGSLMASPLATSSAASPTGPDSHVHSRRPQRERIACPTRSEPAHTSATDA